jgi:hypothetical protein
MATVTPDAPAEPLPAEPLPADFDCAFDSLVGDGKVGAEPWVSLCGRLTPGAWSWAAMADEGQRVRVFHDAMPSGTLYLSKLEAAPSDRCWCVRVGKRRLFTSAQQIVVLLSATNSSVLKHWAQTAVLH